MRKGQAEFIIVLGVVIIAVVAILFALRVPGIVPGPSLEEQSVRNSLENLIRSGAQETMRTLSEQGGYASPSGGVQFLGKTIPYWQRDGTVTVPDVKTAFTKGLEQYINANKESFVSGLGEVTVGTARVTSTFLPDKIRLQVNLPATRNGNQMQSQYDIDILTRFGEVISFAEDFSHKEAENHYLEYFTLSSMVAAPFENGYPTTPFFISLISCGQAVTRTWEQVRLGAEDRLQVTLAHTYMPGKAPAHVGEVTPFPKYVLPLGKSYDALDVSFHLPDDFELDAQNFQFTPNPIVAVAKSIGFTGICTSNPIYVNYNLVAPVIVRVKDPLTQNVFQFVNTVAINRNAPRDWAVPSGEEDVQTQICKDNGCSASLHVTDSSGAVENAQVSFMGCVLGQTDSSGALAASTPCGIGPLQIVKENHDIFIEPHVDNDLQNMQVRLTELVSPLVTVYHVPIVKSGTTYSAQLIELLPENRKAFLTLTGNGQSYNRVIDGAVGTLDQMPVGTYLVQATLADANFQQLFGQVQTTLTITPSTTSLHLYLPDSYEYSQLGFDDVTTSLDLALAFRTTLEGCGIGPFSTVPVSEDLVPCSKEVA